MSDDRPPEKPPSAPPVAPPPVGAFPPVPRPSGTPPASVSAPVPAPAAPDPVPAPPPPPDPSPLTSVPSSPFAESPRTEPIASQPKVVETPSPTALRVEPAEAEPPSLEALGVAARPPQLSEPLALEALGPAARLVNIPGSAPDAADLPAPAPSEAVPPTTPSEPTAPRTAEILASQSPAVIPEDRRAIAESTALATRLVSTLLIVTSLVMVIWHMQLTSRENANTGSRYATVEALVDYGTYNIDQSRYIFTPDKVKARGHFVSSKPPLLPTYGAGVYWLLKRVTGWNITDNESIVVWTVGVFTGWLSHLVFLLYFYRLCRLLLVRQLAVLLTVAAACFAYLGVAYATAINNHSVGAALAVAGFYYAFRARHGLGGRWEWVVSGVILGVLPAIDLSSLALTGLTGIYLARRNLRRTLLLYVPVTLPGIASQLLLAHAATGTWIPAYADTALMTYKGSYFGGHRSGIDALFEPKPVYAFNVLIGHHGLFSMTPIFCFSLFEMVRRLVKRDKFVAETLIFTICVTVVTAFYIFRTHNYGGWCVGMRWLVPIMPWLVLLFGMWLDRAELGRLKWSLVVVAFAVSAFNVQDGLTSPFQFSVWHNFLENAPNRNRIGPTWVLSRPEHRRPPRPPRPKGK